MIHVGLRVNEDIYSEAIIQFLKYRSYKLTIHSCTQCNADVTQMLQIQKLRSSAALDRLIVNQVCDGPSSNGRNLTKPS